MYRNLRYGLLAICLLAALTASAQDQSASQTPSQNPPAGPQAIPPPKEVPSNVNTGRGFSIEPLYWYTNVRPEARPGAAFAASDPASFVFPGTGHQSPGGIITIPAVGTSVVRISYFQTVKDSGTIATQDFGIFGNQVTNGDVLGTRYELTDYKISYDYLTYFFSRGGHEFRVKTLWEFQYFNANTNFTDFIPNGDGTFTPTPFNGSRSIFLPTLGLGLENTLGRHFRWEVKASGFGLPHRSVIGDFEGDLALRFGHIELVAGGKAFHFKTSPKKDEYIQGTLYGPYVGLRFYWKKR